MFELKFNTLLWPTVKVPYEHVRIAGEWCLTSSAVEDGKAAKGC